MHPLAQIELLADPPSFSKAETRRIRKLKPDKDNVNPQVALIRKMIIRSKHGAWYADHTAKLRGMERAEGL